MNRNVFDLAIEDLLLSAGFDIAAIKQDDGAEIKRSELEAFQAAYLERGDYFNAIFGTRLNKTTACNLTRCWKASVQEHWGIGIRKRRPGAALDKGRPVRYYKLKVAK